jgi:hypothetical protein
MLGQAQLDTDIAESIVQKIREGSSTNQYYEEKLALKMLEFFKHEEKMITLYVEAKADYSLLAELMENKRPYLKDLLDEATKLHKQSLLG